jgi:hypothetical protein
MQLNAKLIRHFLRAKYRSSGGVSVLDVPIVDVPIESGANGNNKYTTSGGDSSGVCSGQHIYRVPVRLHTRRCFSSALATILRIHGKPYHSMGDVFDSDLKVDLLQMQIASQLTQRGDPWAASSRIAPQFTSDAELKKVADDIEANPKSQPTYAFWGFWQADHQRCRRTKHSNTTHQMNRWCSSLPNSAFRGAQPLLGPLEARTSDTYLARVTRAANQVLARHA